MKPTYTPDRTGSAVLILLAIAAAVIGLAALFGLSDKPDVTSIVIAPAGGAESAAVAAAALTLASPEVAFTAEASSNPSADGTTDASSNDLGAVGSAEDGTDPSAESAEGDDEQSPSGTVIAIPTEIPEPTPTPEVAAAVEPTPVPAQGDPTGDGADDAETTSSLAMPSVTGTIEGSFFTRGEENEGAEVAQNLITLRFDADGTGDFQGVLDITYPDGVRILLNMSGPLTLLPTNPQVEADLTGTYTLDSPLDTDDVSETDAELSISSLVSGSGSLCASKCFGFNFPPQ